MSSFKKNGRVKESPPVEPTLQGIENLRRSVDVGGGRAVTSVFGRQRLRAMLADAGVDFPVRDKRDLGYVALKSGLFRRPTLEAFDLARVAERTYRRADEAEKMGSGYAARVGETPSRKEAPLFYSDEERLSILDDLVKAPEPLRYAKSLYATALLVLDNQKEAVNFGIEHSGDNGTVIGPSVLGKDVTRGLKREALGLYEQAGDVLEREGFVDPAARLRAIAAHLNHCERREAGDEFACLGKAFGRGAKDGLCPQGKQVSPDETLFRLQWNLDWVRMRVGEDHTPNPRGQVYAGVKKLLASSQHGPRRRYAATSASRPKALELL